LKELRPTYVGDLRVDQNSGRILGGLPTTKDGVQQQINPNTGMYEATGVKDYLKAKIGSTLPDLPKGFQANINPAGQVIANLMEGIAPGTQQLEYSSQLGKGQANLQTTPTNVIEPKTGRQRRVTEAQALGQPTALSPSEVQAFEGYKPVREDAFKKYQSAVSSDTSLQNMQNILNRGAFKPGKFAGFKSEVASIATGLGIGGDKAKNMSVDTPLFVQTLSDNVSANIQDMAGTISNADVIFQKQRGPQITNPEEAVQYYIDLKQALNKRNKEYYNYVTNNPVPNVVEQWSQTPQGRSSVFEDSSLRKYLPRKAIIDGPDKGKSAYILPNGTARIYD
jgi:hypothetical protein